MATVKSPFPFTGTSTYGGVTLQFQDGEATVADLSDSLAGWLESRGYAVSEESAEDVNPKDLNKADLIAYAEEQGVEVDADDTKAEILAKLEVM